MKINHRCNKGATPERTVKVYKLTDENLRAYGGFQYVLGIKATAPGVGRICSSGWLHAYEDPLLASFFSPTHIHYFHPRLYRAEGKVGIRDGQIKLGCSSLTLIEEIPLPEINIEQRVEIAIRTVMLVYTELAWTEWAEDWLNGKDRSKKSAMKAAEAVEHDWSAMWCIARGAARAAEVDMTVIGIANDWHLYASAREMMWALKAVKEIAASAVEFSMDQKKDLDVLAIIKQVIGGKE